MLKISRKGIPRGKQDLPVEKDNNCEAEKTTNHQRKSLKYLQLRTEKLTCGTCPVYSIFHLNVSPSLLYCFHIFSMQLSTLP